MLHISYIAAQKSQIPTSDIYVAYMSKLCDRYATYMQHICHIYVTYMLHIYVTVICHIYVDLVRGCLFILPSTAVILDLKGFLINQKLFLYINIRISPLLSREKVKHSFIVKSAREAFK